jgi:uncharacterized protein YndB with AHSA1/START domain
MTGSEESGIRILGRLNSADGAGVVRMEERVGVGADDVWQALTDPARLAQWYGVVEGDLRLGGEYHVHVHASGWDGTGRIEACEPSRRLVVRGKDPDEPDEGYTEVTLTADGEQTIVVWEERGMPLTHLAAYGAGIQIHVEDLAAHLAGQDRCDAETRWGQLEPVYAPLAADVHN